ncbi:MAG: hypothetical protein ACREDD_03705 [Methylocella sp.]
MASKKSLSKRSQGNAQPKKAGISGGDGEAATFEPRPRRTLLLVLGMHRSGTSAYTNTFAMLGAALPRNLLSGGCGNEKGHFESVRLIAEHDKMLKEIGSHWYDWNALSEDFFKSALAHTFAARIAEIVREEYEDAALIVVKDPRICRFVPVWREVATLLDATIKIVTPFRNPMEVASSLRKRDNLPVQESLLVWTRHVLDAEFWTRDLPRAFIAYEALLGDWRSVVDQCSKEIGLTFPRRSPKAERQVDIYLDRGLRRNMFGDNEFLSHSNVPGWTKDAYGSLQKLQTDPVGQKVLQKLDQVRADFDRVSSNLASVFAERDQRLMEATDANAQRASEIEKLGAANEAEFAVLEQKAASLEGALREAQTRLWDTEQRLSEALQQRSNLEDELSHTKDNSARLEQEVSLKIDSERQLKCLLEQSNAIALTSQEHLAVEQRSSQHIFAAYAASISTIDQLKQEKAALAVEHDARLEGLNYELAKAGQRLEEQVSRNLQLEEQLTLEKNANGRLLASLAASSANNDGLQIHKLHLRRSLAAGFWRHQSNCAPTAASLNVQALEAIAESQNRLMSGIIDFCHASYIFADKSHRDGVAGTQCGTQISQKRFIYRLLPRLDRAFLISGKVQQMFAIAMSGLFDTGWYLEQNPDVAQSSTSALRHFLLHGGQEGRDPSQLFSAKAYLATYPDVAQARLNPLVHFLYHGLNEGRDVRPPGVPEAG